MGTDQLFISYYYGPIGLYIWASGMIVASICLTWSLVTMESRNLLAVRKLEIAGLLLYALAFGYYSYSNLSVGLASPLPVIYPIITEAILIVLVLACVTRALSLASPVTALAVARVNRVKQIKEQLRETLNEDKLL